MNKTDCQLERISNVTVGFFLTIIGLISTLIGRMIVPVIWLLFTVPVLIVAGIFLVSPRSKACRIIAERARGKWKPPAK